MLAWSLNRIRSYKKRFAILVGLACAEVALRVALPWPMKVVVDHALGSAPPPAWVAAIAGDTPRGLLFFAVITGLVVQVAHQTVLMLHTRSFAVTGQLITRDLRQRLFMHLQGLGLRHHARLPVGDSVYRLEADAAFLEQLMLRGMLPLTFSLLTLFVMFGILVSVDRSLALVSLAVVPFLFVWIRWSARKIRPGAERTRQLESRMSARLHESFAAIRLVKAFGREPYEGVRYADAASEAMGARLALTGRESWFSLIVSSLIVLGTSAVILVGGMLVIDGRLTVGTLLIALAYLGFVYGPLSGIAGTTSVIQQALASAGRVRETLELDAEMDHFGGGTTAPRIKGHIAFEHVTFGYDARAVLHDISFTAEPGQLVAFVGPSGSGKTTLVSLVPRFFDPISGRILIDGVDATRYELRGLRMQIAIVLQEGLVLSGTIRDNLRYGNLRATPEQMERAARAAHAHDFIAKLPKGYDTEIAVAGSGLSGGERQRLSIARAFLKDAPILILDEPTSALDRVSERLVFEALKELRAGRTTFVIAHRLSTVRDADQVIVLDAGRIVAQGTHDELMRTSDLYRRLASEFSDTQPEGRPE